MKSNIKDNTDNKKKKVEETKKNIVTEIVNNTSQQQKDNEIITIENTIKETEFIQVENITKESDFIKKENMVEDFSNLDDINEMTSINIEHAKHILLSGFSGNEAEKNVFEGIYDRVDDNMSNGVPTYIRRVTEISEDNKTYCIEYWIKNKNDYNSNHLYSKDYEDETATEKKVNKWKLQIDTKGYWRIVLKPRLGKRGIWIDGYFPCEEPYRLEEGSGNFFFDQDGWKQNNMTVTSEQKEIDAYIKAKEEERKQYVISKEFLEEKAGKFEDESSMDDIRIKTFYNMAEDVTIKSTGGMEVQKKVLYLTNKQAGMIDEKSMEKCIDELEIGKPKFVIILLTALGDSRSMSCHWERSQVSPYSSSPNMCSEINFKDEDIVRTQTILFMKTVILPLAIQTKALIIVDGRNDCLLGDSLAKVVLAEQARMGKDCPFSVVAMAHEYDVHYNAALGTERALNSVASQLARGNSSWKKRMPILFEAQKLVDPAFSDYLDPEKIKRLNRRGHISKCDLTLSASRYIIFEGTNSKGLPNDSFLANFKSLFIQSMTKNVPSIAIKSHVLNDRPYIVDLLSRKIPVLLLDTTERAFTMRDNTYSTENGDDEVIIDRRGDAKTDLAKKYQAFPEVDIRINKKEIKRIYDGGEIPISLRKSLIATAKQMVSDKWDELIKESVYNSLSTADLALFHSVLTYGSNDGSLMKGKVKLYQKIKELDKFERENRDANKSSVPSDLATQVIVFLEEIEKTKGIQAQLAFCQKWIDKNPKDEKINNANEYLYSYSGYLETLKKESLTGLISDFFLDTLAILTHPLTFSGSIHSTEDLDHILRSVAKIDRLPSSNSLEALRTLQDAWNHIELYHKVARSYKFVSKITYILLLSFGAAVTVLAQVAVCSNNGSFSSRIPILAISLSATVVAGYVAYTNPAVRWQELRMAALIIESNIWQFRCRAGEYRSPLNGIDDNAPDNLLKDSIDLVKSSVLEGADMKGTSFYSLKHLYNEHYQQDPADISKDTFLSWFFGNNQGYANGRNPKVIPDQVRKRSQSKSKNPTSLKESDMIISRHSVNVQSEVDIESQLKGDSDKNMESNKKPKLSDDEVLIPLEEFLTKISNIQDKGRRDDHDRKDSHFEPLQPNEYIMYRIDKALKYYIEKIPVCTRSKNIAQLLLISGSVATAALAYVDETSWAPIVSITTASISAFLEYQGTVSKITRYSGAVHSLEELKLWWNTLPPIEKSSVVYIDKLVLTAEDVLQREQQAWKSTSNAIKLLRKEAANAAGSTDNNNTNDKDDK